MRGPSPAAIQKPSTPHRRQPISPPSKSSPRLVRWRFRSTASRMRTIRRASASRSSRAAPLSLSYRVPVIENHGLRVVNERTYHIMPSATPAPAPVWLHDMTIEANDGKPIVIGTEFNHRLEASIMVVVGDRAESDGYNALILRTALSWREISAIRALSRYLRQIRAPFSQDYMWETLRKNTAITISIVALFQARFDPHLVATGAERSARQTT